MADDNSRAVARFSEPRIPYHPAIGERFGVDQAGWRALIDAVWPAAKTADAVVLALSYCRARKLDPFKRPVHIVPVWSSEAKRMVESVWPGIGELRTTAFRTGLYGGRDATEYGPEMEVNLDGIIIDFPEWARVTVYRLSRDGTRMAFPGPRVYWLETYATAGRDTKRPNAMWLKRPRGQIDKCAEAASLRAAFPEEIGDEYTQDEMSGQVIEHVAAVDRPLPGDEIQAEVAQYQRNQQVVQGLAADTSTAETVEHGEATDSVAAEEQEEQTEQDADAQEHDDDTPFRFAVVDMFGEFVFESVGARACVEQLGEELDKAERERGADGVETVWSNNAQLIYNLRDQGHNNLAALANTYYGERFAAAKAAAEQHPGTGRDHPRGGEATQTFPPPGGANPGNPANPAHSTLGPRTPGTGSPSTRLAPPASQNAATPAATSAAASPGHSGSGDAKPAPAKATPGAPSTLAVEICKNEAGGIDWPQTVRDMQLVIGGRTAPEDVAADGRFARDNKAVLMKMKAESGRQWSIVQLSLKNRRDLLGGTAG